MKDIIQWLENVPQGMSVSDDEFLSCLKAVEIPSGCFLEGRLVQPESRESIENLSPIMGLKINDIPDCDEPDVTRAAKSGKAAFDSGVWSRMPKAQRKEVLMQIAKTIDVNALELAVLDALDVGKPVEMARDIDIWTASDAFRWYGELCDKMEDRIAPTDNLDLVMREPIGVVGAVTPWNFPMMILAWKVAPMLAAGNSVLLKPAEESTLSALRFAQICSEAGLPDGVLSVVPGGERAGRAVGLSELVSCVGFTGSTEVGKKFLTYAGQSNMKSVFLECGGKSPFIVLDDADEIAAADALASGVFYNAGQSCNAPTRAIVHSSKVERFLDQLVDSAAGYAPNNPFARGTSVGCVVSKSQVLRIDQLVKRAVSEGAVLLAGGEPLNLETGGFYYAPTVLSNTTPDMEINQTEIFGPIITVQAFHSSDEAIRSANNSIYGLWANVWTNRVAEAIEFARRIEAGTVAFNCVWGGDNTTPMGGYKQSGIGRDRGVDSFEKYTQIKHVSLLPPGSDRMYG